TRPGEYLIAYTLEDSAGNHTSLFLRYALAEREMGAGLDGSGHTTDELPYTGDGLAGGGWRHGDPARCGVHWALLGLALSALVYTLLRCRQEEKEELDENS
ncbi:hypothetical protein, partial [Bittarella massiliensis (ex Durand et al. 2017)]|uniref:hypothetical protein n=1 Tax=Bittarella massiliensis (ex Durand et al. 2017) TaxID=1720313 RepID=UPI001AA0D421